MTAPSVGFIGAGRVARIFLRGWARAGVTPPDVVAYDPDGAVLTGLRSLAPTVRAVELAEAAAADIVLVAVHPPVAREVFAGLRDVLGAGSVVVSMVPTIRLAGLADILGAERPVARLIPNAPSVVGAGFNPIAFNAAADDAARGAVRGLLAPLGRAPEMPDESLEAYAVLTAMGPTYLWPQLVALLDVAAATGLSDDAAREGLAAMVDGAVRTLLESGLPAADVVDLVPSKPLAAPVAAMTAAYGDVLTGLHAKLSGAVPSPA